MADLTPPSSKQNTPQRPLDPTSDVPSSPTTKAKQAHPLAINTADMNNGESSGSEEMELIETTDGEGEAEGDVDELMSEGEEPEFVDAQGEVFVQSEGELEIGAEKLEEAEAEVVETEPIQAVPGEERSSGKAKKKAKRERAKQSSKRATGKAIEAPRLKGKGRKDVDLYESEIVARWNNEIGDVFLDRPKPGPSVSA